MYRSLSNLLSTASESHAHKTWCFCSTTEPPPFLDPKHKTRATENVEMQHLGEWYLAVAGCPPAYHQASSKLMGFRWMIRWLRLETVSDKRRCVISIKQLVLGPASSTGGRRAGRQVVNTWAQLDSLNFSANRVIHWKGFGFSCVRELSELIEIIGEFKEEEEVFLR